MDLSTDSGPSTDNALEEAKNCVHVILHAEHSNAWSPCCPNFRRAREDIDIVPRPQPLLAPYQDFRA
jgi:hypothetical protein